MSDLTALIDGLVAELVPDRRLAVAEIRVEEGRDGATLTGETTEPELISSILTRLQEMGERDVTDAVLRLPDPAIGGDRAAIVRAAIAPLHPEPRISTAQTSQYIHGHRLEILSRRGSWWRVRGADGYIGWVHQGYLTIGDDEWADHWVRGQGGEPAISLGAEIVGPDRNLLARVPWGARVVRQGEREFRLPDGRTGELGAGTIIDAHSVGTEFPAAAEELIGSAMRWLATPYLWGGVTPFGADCSGFVQSIFWLHGLELPRDSDQQAEVGTPVLVAGSGDLDLATIHPADLLFFTEGGRSRVSHVAISLGGSAIIHSALSNGGVACNDLEGTAPVERELREGLVRVTRLLPQPG